VADVKRIEDMDPVTLRQAIAGLTILFWVLFSIFLL
jgi:hypothetical protein